MLSEDRVVQEHLSRVMEEEIPTDETVLAGWLVQHELVLGRMGTKALKLAYWTLHKMNLEITKPGRGAVATEEPEPEISFEFVQPSKRMETKEEVNASQESQPEMDLEITEPVRGVAATEEPEPEISFEFIQPSRRMETKDEVNALQEDKDGDIVLVSVLSFFELHKGHPLIVSCGDRKIIIRKISAPDRECRHITSEYLRE